MLIFERQKEESFVIDLTGVDLSKLANKLIEVKYLGYRGNNARIGITADRSIPVHRRETRERILASGPQPRGHEIDGEVA